MIVGQIQLVKTYTLFPGIYEYALWRIFAPDALYLPRCRDARRPTPAITPFRKRYGVACELILHGPLRD
jgi:hypothetical protein